jgi:hypothetical protein
MHIGSVVNTPGYHYPNNIELEINPSNHLYQNKVKNKKSGVVHI